MDVGLGWSRIGASLSCIPRCFLRIKQWWEGRCQSWIPPFPSSLPLSLSLSPAHPRICWDWEEGTAQCRGGTRAKPLDRVLIHGIMEWLSRTLKLFPFHEQGHIPGCSKHFLAWPPRVPTAQSQCGIPAGMADPTEALAAGKAHAGGSSQAVSQIPALPPRTGDSDTWLSPAINLRTFLGFGMYWMGIPTL